jgi:hypothetical protein
VRDEQELRGILIYVAAASTATVAAAVGMALSPGPWSLLLTLLLFYVILIALIFGWLPRVTARRLAAELTEDPAPSSGTGANGGCSSWQRFWVF